jgi:hypothetical protein
MKHPIAAAKAASILALAALALAGCDRPDQPKTVVIEKDTTIVRHEPTVVIRDDRDHHDNGARPDDHMGQPHGPPPAGDHRDDRR